jgi:2-polyprenyl-3-methyl-5-hydroxy-6-metoxy-1,4-benzoquinol methylase
MKNMGIVQRGLTKMSSFIKSYGPSNLKRLLWDKEYSGDKWDFADHTLGDCVYAHLEKHAANGSILDLGCGSGNTGAELAANAYTHYVGVDISEACLSKATKRSKETGRAEKNSFERGDFLSYTPSQQFDVILFRESMYHVPMGKITTILDRYSKYLKDGGTFVVRMKTAGPDGNPKERPTAMIGIIEENFGVVEKCEYPEAGSTVITFRSQRHAQNQRAVAAMAERS